MLIDIFVLYSKLLLWLLPEWVLLLLAIWTFLYAMVAKQTTPWPRVVPNFASCCNGSLVGGNGKQMEAQNRKLHSWAHSGNWRLSFSSLFHSHLLITDNTKKSHWYWTMTCAGHLTYIISDLHHHSAVRHHYPLSHVGILSLRQTWIICQIPCH